MQALRLIALFGCTAALCLYLAHRFLLPISRAAAAALLLLPLLPTGRAVLTGDHYGPLNFAYNSPPLAARRSELPEHLYRNGPGSDAAIQMIPWRAAVRAVAAAGDWPLINPFMLCGDILLATVMPAVFHPATWLGFLLPLATAWTLASALMYFTTALCAFLFLRDLGLSERIAFFGASAWMLSSHTVLLDGRPNSFVFACFPLLLLGVRRLAARGRGGFGATTLALVLMLLAGHPESVLFGVAGAGVFFLFELVAARSRIAAIGRSVLAGLFALALCAVALLPFFEASEQTLQGRHRRDWYAHQPKSIPLADAVSGTLGVVLPKAYGDEFPSPRMPGAFPYATLAYLGGLPLGLAMIGVFSRRRESLALLAAGLLALAVANGYPIIADIVCGLPLFNISIQNYLIGVTAFSVAALAALGLDAVIARRAAAPAVWLCLLGAAIVAFALRWRVRFPEGGNDRRAFDESVFLLIEPLVLFALATLFFRGSPQLATLAAALLLIARLAEKPELAYAFDRRLFFPPVPELQSLPRDPEPYRVTGVGYSLVPNISALYGLEDPRGYQALNFGRLFSTYPLWSVQQPMWFNRIDDLTRPFLSMLNVRYAIADPPADPPEGWRLHARGRHAAVFENTRALPRAFAPRRVRFVRDGSTTVDQMAACRDFGELSWIEDPSRPPGEFENPPARVTTTRRGSGLDVRVISAAPVWVVVSQTAWTGWEARLEGDLLPLRFANHAFLGFPVPPGDHRVRLDYRPPAFRRGAAVSAAALLILAVGAAVSRKFRPARSVG